MRNAKSNGHAITKMNFSNLLWVTNNKTMHCIHAIKSFDRHGPNGVDLCCGKTIPNSEANPKPGLPRCRNCLKHLRKKFGRGQKNR